MTDEITKEVIEAVAETVIAKAVSKQVDYYFDEKTKSFYPAQFIESYQGITVEECTTVTQDEFNMLIDLRNKGAMLYVENGKVKASKLPPSKAHIYNEQSKAWELNEQKQKEFLKEQKKELKTLLKNKCNAITDEYLKEYPQAEVLSFSLQKDQAVKYLEEFAQGGEIDLNKYPVLTMIAKNRKVEINTLAKWVIEKSTQFEVLTGTLAGIRQKFKDLINNAKTDEQLTAIKQEINQWTM